MYVLQNLHWFVLLIGVLVFFHELGHFLFAKLFGVKVERFSIGFGPKLLGITRGETEYWLSAFPLGGYVKMLGEAPNSPIPEEEIHRAFLHKPVWQRALIALAGPLFNMILAYAVYVGMFAGTHTFGDTKLGIVTVGEPAWNAGLRPGDRVLAIDGKTLDDWDDLRAAIAARPAEPMVITYERDGTSRQTTVVPEHSTQPDVFQEPETRGKIGISLQYVKPSIGVVDAESPAAKAGLRTGDTIVEVNGKPVHAWHEVRDEVARVTAEQSAITLLIDPVHSACTNQEQKGDSGACDGAEVVARPGVQIDPSTQRMTVHHVVPSPHFPAGLSRDLLSSADTASGYTGLVSDNVVVGSVDADTPAARAGIQPGDRLIRVAITDAKGNSTTRPIDVWEIDLGALNGIDALQSDVQITVQRQHAILPVHLRLTERKETDELKNVHKVLVFGAHPAARGDEGLGTYLKERRIGPGEALTEAAQQVSEDATLIARGLARLVQGKLPMESMGGVIMLFVIAEKSAKKGAQVFLRTMAVISVNLGMLNLLPVPVLDGGHLLFCAIEAVRRKPASIRVREWANTVGLILLLLLMLLAFRNDIVRYMF